MGVGVSLIGVVSGLWWGLWVCLSPAHRWVVAGLVGVGAWGLGVLLGVLLAVLDHVGKHDLQVITHGLVLLGGVLVEAFLEGVEHECL